MTPDVCIYHANCMDGFTAAWVVQRRFPGVKMIPAGYDNRWLSMDDVAGKHILIVDFSYRQAQLTSMGGYARSITVLDHHKTAAAELAPFEVGPIDLNVVPEHGAVLAHFDMEKSGARLAWEYCFPGQPAPAIVDYTEDRDLWRWKLPDSREINAALGSYEQTIENWDEFGDGAWFAHLRGEGVAILRQRDKDVDAVIDTTWRWMVIGGVRVPVANAPFFLASEIGNKLSEGNPFAATYFDNSNGERIFSLRSQSDDGADVAEIAKGYGGGGHQHAAGFKMPKGWEGDV